MKSEINLLDYKSYRIPYIDEIKVGFEYEYVNLSITTPYPLKVGQFAHLRGYPMICGKILEINDNLITTDFLGICSKDRIVNNCKFTTQYWRKGIRGTAWGFQKKEHLIRAIKEKRVIVNSKASFINSGGYMEYPTICVSYPTPIWKEYKSNPEGGYHIGGESITLKSLGSYRQRLIKEAEEFNKTRRNNYDIFINQISIQWSKSRKEWTKIFECIINPDNNGLVFNRRGYVILNLNKKLGGKADEENKKTEIKTCRKRRIQSVKKSKKNSKRIAKQIRYPKGAKRCTEIQDIQRN